MFGSLHTTDFFNHEGIGIIFYLLNLQKKEKGTSTILTYNDIITMQIYIKNIKMILSIRLPNNVHQNKVCKTFTR